MPADPEHHRPHFETLGPMEFEETACPVCGATSTRKPLEKVVQGITSHFATCTRCATLYSNPRLTVNSLKNLYSSQEFFEGKDANLNYYSFLAGEGYLRKTARGRVRRIQEHASGGKLLEVASAAGFFLAEAKAAGFECEGVEISGPMAAYASKRWEVPVRAGSIEETDLPESTYDVIASWGVMTIIRDPIALMAKFHRALKPGGIWVFNTYDTASLWGRAFGTRWYILVPNTSQIHHDATLRSVIDDAGFTLISRRRDHVYASIERLLFVLATHLGDQRVPRAVFERIHALNRVMLPVVTPDTYVYTYVKR